MKHTPLLLAVLAAVALPVAALHAADDHGHGHKGHEHKKHRHDHHGHGHHGHDHHGHHHDKLPKVPGDVRVSWDYLMKKMAAMEAATTGKDYDVICDTEPHVRACLKVLGEKSDMVDAKNAKRLEGALKSATKASHSVHAASDAKDQAALEKSLKQLQGTLKLIQAQYPANTLPKIE